MASPPIARIACAVSRPPASLTSNTAMRAPSSAKRWQVASPIPVPPPVTMQILSESRPIPPSSDQDHAAVDHDRLAGHVVGGGRGQECREAGHVLGRRGATEQDRLREFVNRLL